MAIRAINLFDRKFILIVLLYQRMTKKLFWTNHSKGKMGFYKLSPGRVRRVLNSPHRLEMGIAPDTIAVMQSVKGKRPWEIWVLLEETEDQRRVISAWRYPGVTKPGDQLPKEILSEVYQLRQRLKTIE